MSKFPAIRIVRAELSEPQHAEAFVELLEHYARDPMGGGRGLAPSVREELVPRLRARLDFTAFFAFDAAIPVGLVNCFEGFSTFAARPLLNVHDIVVRDAYRGQGIGGKLLAAAEDEARLRGCCKLTLEVLSNNRAALATYDRAGFRPYVLDPAAGQALFLQKWIDSL